MPEVIKIIVSIIFQRELKQRDAMSTVLDSTSAAERKCAQFRCFLARSAQAVGMAFVLIGSPAAASAEDDISRLSEILVKHFSQSYFRQEMKEGVTNKEYPIVRWEREIKISISTPELMPKEVSEYGADLVAELQSSGIKIRINANESDYGNVKIILVNSKNGFTKRDVRLLKLYMLDKEDLLEEFVARFEKNPTCHMGGTFSKKKKYRAITAFAAINVNRPIDNVRNCFGRMIAGILGFQGGVVDGVVKHSIFSIDIEADAHISDWDRLAFRMLADTRLIVGTRYSQASRALLKQIANDLLSAWPNRAGLVLQLAVQ